MRPILLFALLITCFLFVQPETRAAETNVYTDISFDDETGVVSAYAYTRPDYSSNVYYNRVGVFVRIINTATGAELAYRSSETTGVYVQAGVQVDGEADQEYEAQGGHYLFETVYRSMYYYNGYYMSGYSDFYNYGRYEGQVPGPNNVAGFTFYGPGPEIITYNNLRRLGYTDKKTKVGRPHHLWVVSDDIITGSCGRLERHITYQIVDVDNRKTGNTRAQEQFDGRPIYDGCSGYEVVPSPCLMFKNGVIPDEVRVGIPGPAGTCPPSIDGSCGYTIDVNRWQWCSLDGRTPVTLGTFTYDVHWNHIGINGRYTSWPKDGQFFP